ncbi:MAG: TonB-dependent receptor plug domain-containing protein [Woeseiaceae bacterium]
MLLVGVLFSVVATAADGPVAPFAGRPVADVIDEFREAGLPFAYSTGLVGTDLLVTKEPESTDPFDLINEILEPHDLTLQTIAGVHLVIRTDRSESSPAATAGQETPPGGGGAAIEMIVVSASRYEISREISSSRFQLDRRSIQTMPDFGDDPVRITQRLPGAAASGASARSHFRGGNTDEIGIMLNGQWLFDPFHVRDYQSIFSSIDSRAISGVEVYTGGFPVRYGDRMSGLVLMESMAQEKPRHTEIGVSVFNTSVLTSGTSDDKRWLFSARRGNLDLVIDPKFGEPSYYDVFGEFGLDLTDDTTFSINALYADDRVKVITEADPDELEQVVSSTTNAQVWGQLETRWSDTLSSSTVLSATVYKNLRTGSMNDPEKLIGVVRDEREIDQFSLRQDWSWQPSETHFVQWGLQGSWGDAWYDYAGTAQYFGLMALYEGQPQTVVRTATAAPEGGSIALYLSDRWRLSPKMTLEWGLRWDDQSYTELRSDAQISPRINVLFAMSQDTELRLTWGLYQQSQRIQELQIEDGITRFWPAERSDHVIVGLRKLFDHNIALRVEAFYKDMSRVRPRFENLYDPLSIIPEFQPDRIAIAPDRARSTGIEISLDRSVGNWDWWASYTLARATDRISSVNEARSWDQRHAFQGGLTWTDERWTAGVAASVHSGWPATDLALEQRGLDPAGEPVYVAVPGPRNVLQHNTFASVDVRLSRKFDVKRGSLTAFVEISNVLNRRNVCCLDWDVTDENGNVELELSNDYWLPLLPAVGVLWEF